MTSLLLLATFTPIVWWLLMDDDDPETIRDSARPSSHGVACGRRGVSPG